MNFITYRPKFGANWSIPFTALLLIFTLAFEPLWSAPSDGLFWKKLMRAFSVNQKITTIKPKFKTHQSLSQAFLHKLLALTCDYDL